MCCCTHNSFPSFAAISNNDQGNPVLRPPDSFRQQMLVSSTSYTYQTTRSSPATVHRTFLEWRLRHLQEASFYHRIVYNHVFPGAHSHNDKPLNLGTAKPNTVVWQCREAVGFKSERSWQATITDVLWPMVTYVLWREANILLICFLTSYNPKISHESSVGTAWKDLGVIGAQGTINVALWFCRNLVTVCESKQ
jgi:hypothetical protein